MAQLFLSEPTWSGANCDEPVKERIFLLSQLESVLWSLITTGGRSEARLWLCNTLSGIKSLTRGNQLELFLDLFRINHLKQRLAAQLLHMIFEKQPHKAGNVIANKSYIMEKFFKGNPRRILQWFSSFAAGGDLRHRKGAKALSQFAFVNRDICWEELEWKGKHGQSPAMVATKPHYFLDLDVQRTVENFLEYVPEFWSSNEFADSLRDGDIIFIDMKFFVDLFVDLMCKEDSKEVWEMIDEFLMEESFASLCQHLLIILDESDLCIFLRLIRKFLNRKVEMVGISTPSSCLEVILSQCSDYESIEQLLLLNALISQGRQVLRLVREEENQEEKLKIKDIISQICTSSNESNIFGPIIEECFKCKTVASIKWLALQSWALHYRLSEEYRAIESWESLFTSNGISFRQSEKYALLDQDGFSDGWGSDMNEREVKIRRRKNERGRKKRRRESHHGGIHDDELLDVDVFKDRTGLQSSETSWLLSVDEYSTSWTIVDLPEYLSKYCVLTWMKWIFAKWRDS